MPMLGKGQAWRPLVVPSAWRGLLPSTPERATKGAKHGSALPVSNLLSFRWRGLGIREVAGERDGEGNPWDEAGLNRANTRTPKPLD